MPCRFTVALPEVPFPDGSTAVDTEGHPCAPRWIASKHQALATSLGVEAQLPDDDAIEQVAHGCARAVRFRCGVPEKLARAHDADVGMKAPRKTDSGLIVQQDGVPSGRGDGQHLGLAVIEFDAARQVFAALARFLAHITVGEKPRVGEFGFRDVERNPQVA